MDGGKEKRLQWIHNVEVIIVIVVVIKKENNNNSMITNSLPSPPCSPFTKIIIKVNDLEPGMNHFYRVGSTRGW